MNALRFNLNGTWVEEQGIAPTTTLLRYLRDSARLTGTKEGCAEGDCGACTVIVVETNEAGAPAFRAVNSCLLLLPMIQGKHVLTVEALKKNGALHPVQDAMTKALGSQCGYCTPGFVMTMFEAAYRGDFTEPWQLDDQLCGNLCRCTGYRPIRDAAKVTAGSCTGDSFDESLARSKPLSMALTYRTATQAFFTPSSLPELFDLLDAHPDARLVNGGTDLSLEITKRFQLPAKLISLEGIEAFRGISSQGALTRFGSGVVVSVLEAASVQAWPALHRMVRYFGARQIKHRATIGGNLCTASPIGDLAPVLMSLDATAVMVSRKGERRVKMEDFFTGYRTTALEPNELLAAVELPALKPDARSVAYKVSKRRELDISTVSAGLYLETNSVNEVIAARLAYGGMAATPARAKKAEAALLGQQWNEASAERGALAIAGDFKPLDDHRGSASYRSAVAANLLRGFFEETRSSRQPALLAGHTGTVQLELPNA